MPATCDTSVLVPALLAWHPHHAVAHAALRRNRPAALPAHVYVETLAAMTRLPDPRRPTVQIAHEVLERLGLPLITLSEAGYVAMVGQLAAVGVGGAAAYDALVGATAAEHAHVLTTADHRARTTYDAVGATYEFLEFQT